MLGISRGPGMSTLVSVQYLRAFAAIIVVYYHIFSNRVAASWSAGHNFGIMGVDIFFIISGFIMWVSTSHRPGGPLKFLKRRAYRIYPMWWIALTIWIVSRLIVPDRLHNADVTAKSLICSYFLIPHFHNVFIGRIWPILVPGWTLQLEIFFYALFGLSLLLSTRLIRFCLILCALCLLTVFGMVAAPENAVLITYTDPLLLEFGAGVVFAALLPVLQRVPFMFGVAAILFGIICVYLSYDHIVDSGIARVLVLGIPAAFIVGGALVLEPMLARRRSKFLLLLGDASYSLYLTHPIAISLAAVIWEKLKLPSGNHHAAIYFVPVALAVSLTVAVLTYKWVETPILNRLIYARKGTSQPPALPTTALEAEGLVQEVQ
jgi:exopolysaccharide production protein ExoZ